MVRCEEVSVVTISLLHIVLSDSITSASFLLHITPGGGIPTNVHSIENDSPIRGSVGLRLISTILGSAVKSNAV